MVYIGVHETYIQFLSDPLTIIKRLETELYASSTSFLPAHFPQLCVKMNASMNFIIGVNFVLRWITYCTLQWLLWISANRTITFQPYLRC